MKVKEVGTHEPLTFPISSAPMKDPMSQPKSGVYQKLKQVGQQFMVA